ncbi:MAG: hypothetical protein ACKO5Q_21390 [Microcystaceae cyanobacterium]
MNNDFDDENNLDALLRDQQNLESRILELRRNKESLNAQLPRQELERTRQELNDSLQSFGIIDRLRYWAGEADKWIQDQNFRKAFCHLYRQWMTKNVGTIIDLANLAALIATIASVFTIPPLIASFSAIGILRRLGDGYCEEFIEND